MYCLRYIVMLGLRNTNSLGWCDTNVQFVLCVFKACSFRNISLNQIVESIWAQHTIICCTRAETLQCYPLYPHVDFKSRRFQSRRDSFVQLKTKTVIMRSKRV